MQPSFLIPFASGVAFLFFTLVLYYVKWYRQIGLKNRVRLKYSVRFTWLYDSLLEIFRESLLHLRIMKENVRLWYMHMSLAFGWFLLILVGHVESVHHSGNFFSSPTHAIFLDYFTRGEEPKDGFAAVLNHVMDFLLLFILSGLLLAVYKRFFSRHLGMKKKPRHQYPDRLALTFLWLIFPARLVAESLNHTFYGGGGFATAFLGDIIRLPHSYAYLSESAWWAYSLVLCGFFLVLPFSRYMHILTEIIHIFLKNARTKVTGDEGITSFHVHACSSCGICMNTCQLNDTAMSTGQSVNFIRNYRRAGPVDPVQTMNCLMCGRCNVSCPVRVDSIEIRMNERNRSHGRMLADYSYLDDGHQRKGLPARIAFFGGCMTQLTPSIVQAMKKIFMMAGEDYRWVDADENICCGRPLQLSGQFEAYRAIVQKTRQRILECQPGLLVTSCPICLHTFSNDYNLKIPVMHHSQYLDTLISQGVLKPMQTWKPTVYHDPCELGRKSGIYYEPRRVLQGVTALENPGFSEGEGMCCGGSLGDFELEYADKQIIARKVMKSLLTPDTEQLATSCPLCKKTFRSACLMPVRDIAEIVADALMMQPAESRKEEIRADVDAL